MSAAERGEAPFPEVQTDQREGERRRLEAKRTYRIYAASYVFGNLFLVIIWAISGKGYFWPGWVMAGSGLLLLFTVYLRKPITAADIDEELRFRGWLSGRPPGETPSQEGPRRTAETSRFPRE